MRSRLLPSSRKRLSTPIYYDKAYLLAPDKRGAKPYALQQLLYADEVRSLKDLDIEKVEVTKPELQLALQLIDQISEDSYEPAKFEDAEKKRILAAIDAKIAGQEVVASAHNEQPSSGQVIDLMDALRASLGKKAAGGAPVKAGKPVDIAPALGLSERKGVKRASEVAAEDATPAKTRARK